MHIFIGAPITATEKRVGLLVVSGVNSFTSKYFLDFTLSDIPATFALGVEVLI